MTAEQPSSDQAIDRLRESWPKEERLTAEDLLQAHPNLADDSTAAVDVIYAEILLRESQGDAPSEGEYCERFPQYQELIARQFQLHRALGQMVGDASTVNTAVDEQTLPTNAGLLPSVQHLDIPGFEIEAVIGRGGSGIAYRANDLNLKRTVAIKFLQALADSSRQHLVREAEAAAALVNKNIVQVHQIGDAQGTPFLVMEYIDGESLAQRLQSGPMPTAKAVELLIDVANAIHFAHTNGIVHRDLKPGNVLLDQEGSPKVCDFGLARKLDSEFTLHKTGDVVGTPAYMSPEQARGEPATTSADVYSLGAVLYHCLTGRPPFQAATPWEILNQVMTDDPVAARQLNAAIPKDLDTICAAALNKLPGRRIASAAEFAAELTRFRTGQPIQSRPVGLLERAWKLSRRNPAMSSLIGVSAVALATIAGVAVFSQRKVASALQQTEIALTDAKTQRDVAFSAMKNLVNEVHGDLQKHEASVEARGEVLSSAINGLQQIIDTSDIDADIMLTMSTARAQYGYILAQQGQNGEANSQYEQAVEIAGKVGNDEGRLAHATALALLANQYTRVADRERSLQAAEESVAEFEELSQTLPSSTRLRRNFAAARSNLGQSLITFERHEEGLEQLTQARTLAKAVHDDDPEGPSVARQLLEIDMSLAFQLFAFAKVDSAEAMLSEAMQLIDADPHGIESDTQLNRKYLNCCQLLGRAQFGRMDFEQGITTLNIAKAGYERLIVVEPERPGFRLKLAVVHDLLGRCLYSLGQLEEAEENFLVSVEQFVKGMELGGPEYRVQRSAIAAEYAILTDLYIRLDKLDEAIVTAGKVGDALRPLIEEYQLQSMVDNLNVSIEVLKGVAGHETTANEKDISRARRAHTAWQALLKGDADPFIQSESELLADIEASTKPILKGALLTLLSQCRAVYFKLLSESGDSSPAQIEEAESLTIKAIQQAQAAPEADRFYYIGLPEFAAFRTSKAFQAAFPLTPSAN